MALQKTRIAGMCQRESASRAAAAKPQTEAKRLLLRRTPMRTRTRISGKKAASADRATEWSGSSGCGQAGFMLYGRRERRVNHATAPRCGGIVLVEDRCRNSISRGDARAGWSQSAILL